MLLRYNCCKFLYLCHCCKFLYLFIYIYMLGSTSASRSHCIKKILPLSPLLDILLSKLTCTLADESDDMLKHEKIYVSSLLYTDTTT